VPTDFDIYNSKSWKNDALLQPESRDAYRRLLAQGWIDAIRARHPEEAVCLAILREMLGRKIFDHHN
jgi:exodeoxyribonuclease III